MLKEALQFCEEWEISSVLVTYDKGNIGSRKTIEKSVGISKNGYSEERETILRFWIRGEKQ